VKVIYVCEECKELHKVEALSLIIVKPDMGVKIVGKESVKDEVWNMLIKQLPEMLAHKCNDTQ